MATYAELAVQVLDWSNREKDVLPFRTIKNCLTYAADDAYRTLRIAPLENTIAYQTTEATENLIIPADLIEVIQLRKVDSNEITGYLTYTSKSDIRSFYNSSIRLYGDYGTSDFVFARERNRLLLNPAPRDSETYELYYYRRLSDVDARYAVNQDTEATDTQYYDTDYDNLMDQVRANEDLNSSYTVTDVFEIDPDLEGRIEFDGADITSSTKFWLGREVGNWLRDENEKVYLWGALAKAATFLQEHEGYAAYEGLLQEEIRQLNNEDRDRVAGGGGHIHFSGGGLI